MNLVIDIGNTHGKLAVFDSTLIYTRVVSELKDLRREVEAVLRAYPGILHGILSSVGRHEDGFNDWLSGRVKLHVLSNQSQLPFENAYDTPETLGVDRLALMAAASKFYPEAAVLVIDAGTCVTYDFIDASGVYRGGAISPGLRLRYEALHHFTAKLPLLSKEMPDSITGTSTTASIHSGVTVGLIHEIDGVIDAYKSEYEDLTVILTGGDANFLSKRLKNTIFANSNFLLEGLNHILKFNQFE